MSASAPSQTVFSIGYDFHYGAGNKGNVWGITNYKDNSRNQSFTYDSLNRLTSAQNAGTANPPPPSDCNALVLQGKTEYWGNSYTYDAWGNLTNKTVTKCSAENLNAPALVNNQLAGYNYDAAGNMTSDPTDGVSLSYDQENRITGASGYAYTYDADGNRVLKTNGSTGTLYWYMSPGIVAESDLLGVLKSEYVFFDGERVARRDNPNGTSPSVAYYFSDRLKTASVITDSLGNIKSESDYYPWGGELQFVANDSNHYKFTGKERDETGLDYFGARYYSSGMGRFITPDWAAKAVDVPYAEFADPQSLNLYSYVRNIPTVSVDPDGHTIPIYNPIIISPETLVNAAKAFFHFMTSGPPSFDSLPRSTGGPQGGICGCGTPQNQNNSDTKNSNNSFQQNNEQGRDAQGKFTSKQPGQAAPGAAAEKEALDAVGATKNTQAIPGSNRIPDGTIKNAAGEVEQYVEGKSGASITNTSQLREMAKAAKDATGNPLTLVATNPNVKIAKTVLRNKNIKIVKLNQK